MVLYNATIHTMAGKIIKNGAVVVKNGKIADIVIDAKGPYSNEDFDCGGHDLYPGFVDAHTHLGLIGDGMGIEGDDCNEDTDPVTPNLRAIDGINFRDRCFEDARNAGVTTVVAGCGSANPIGGDFGAFKTSGRCADEMLIRTVGIKFALGENPKSTYADNDSTPVTRMATAAAMRETLFKTRRYMDDMESDSPPDYDAKLEALIPLMNGEMTAFFHCHRADDIMTAVRISKEFSLKYMLVHCTEGYLIADILGKENVSACVGPIICDRGKPELANLTPANAGILLKNGVNVSICTDHPEVPIQYLPLSAAIAVKYGLPLEEAMRAITINAAKMCGIEDRVGSIEIGKDADFALFSLNPLHVMSSPEMVMINGKVVSRLEV